MSGGQYTTTSGPQYVSGGQQYVSGGQYTSGHGYGGGSGVQRAVAEEIPVESRIEYIPFEKKYVEYEQVERIYQVPVESEVIEYEEVVRNERIPQERTITDYYAVETQVEYIKREIEETIMVEEAREAVMDRVQYIPVETQIVHYPERDNYVASQTRVRTENLGVVQNPNQIQGELVGRGEYATRGAYVEGGSRIGQQSSSYAYTQQQPQVYQTAYTTTTPVPTYTSTSANQYQSSYAPTTQAVTYTTGGTTGGYVTGGSGVRQTGYVTGGSGVRGSGVKDASYSYQTSTGQYQY